MSVPSRTRSYPARTSSRYATSLTPRPIGPGESCEKEMPIDPWRLTSPTVGLRPTTPVAEAGQMIALDGGQHLHWGANPAAEE